VNLASAGNYVILASTGISTTGTTAITGDLGVSPVAASYITGFGLILPAGSSYSTSSLVTGKVYASDYAVPTPSILTTAVGDMGAAYNNASGRINPDHLNSPPAAINGPTSLSAGLYKWTTPLSLSATITLTGTSTSVFVFQIGQTLKFNANTNIILSGGVLPKNVIWVSAGQVTLEGGAIVKGVILGKTAVVFKSGATLNGCVLAQTGVTLIANTLTKA
jgi:hypothetical protein